MSTKTCAACELAKAFENFCVDRRKKDGLSSYCRSCAAEKRKLITREQWQAYQNKWRTANADRVRVRSRERYAADPEPRRESSRRWRANNPGRAAEVEAEKRARRRKRLASIKAEAGCRRCGLVDPRVLDFHHLDPGGKDLAVSQLIAKRGWAAVEAEIAKCVVLCANCHRIVHAEAEDGAFELEVGLSELREGDVLELREAV